MIRVWQAADVPDRATLEDSSRLRHPTSTLVRCSTCGGPIYRPTLGGRPSGAWLHADPSTWQDAPHDATPAT
jgi:hypothetical protein